MVRFPDERLGARQDVVANRRYLEDLTAAVGEQIAAGKSAANFACRVSMSTRISSGKASSPPLPEQVHGAAGDLMGYDDLGAGWRIGSKSVMA